MKPPYRKPLPECPGKPPGQKPGHPGHRRAVPSHIGRPKEYRATCCPFCRAPLKRCRQGRTRYTEDIPHLQPEVTQHVTHRHWCPRQMELDGRTRWIPQPRSDRIGFPPQHR
jgi:hypothetical protein